MPAAWIPAATAAGYVNRTGHRQSITVTETRRTMKKRVLFALTSHNRKGHTGQPTGFYLPEAAHPWAVLRDRFEIDFVSTRGGKPPMDGANSADAASRAFLADPDVRRKLDHTPTAHETTAADYAAILFVGGHGTMWDFPDDQDLASVAAAIYEAEGVIGAVCHGPAALVNLKLSGGEYLVAGKRVAAFTDEEERAAGLESVVPFLLESMLRARGAIHIPAPNWQSNVITDGRLVTGQNPASAYGVGQEMAHLLGD
jgi:putative intracellular protease/amidase